jgi:tetratricopeptide (TPR) repeat protein
LPIIARELNMVSGSLTRIEQMIAAPRATAARELRNEGVNLATRGLYEEAKRELAAANAAYGYDPLSHLFLGRVFAETGEDAAAAAEFRSAWRYSPDRSFSAAAALLEAASWRAAGNDEAARQTLAEAADLIPECAEVWLSRASLGDTQSLSQALTIAPELALDDEVAHLPGYSEALSHVLDAGLLEQARETSQRVEELGNLIKGVGEQPAATLPPQPEQPDLQHLFAWCLIVEAEGAAAIQRLAGQLRADVGPTVPPEPKTPDKSFRGGCLGIALAAWLGPVPGILMYEHFRGSVVQKSLTSGQWALCILVSIIAGATIIFLTMLPGIEKRQRRKAEYTAAKSAYDKAVARRARLVAERAPAVQHASEISTGHSPVRRNRVTPLLL